jgi:hypothetical protein
VRSIARVDRWDLAAAASIAFAVWHGLQATAGLRWPYDQDHYRDISQAQSTLDGSPLADPFYDGEFIWYNPLTSWTIAAGSGVTGLSATEFHVRAGPWLNTITPIGFYVLNATLLGRPAAFAGTTSFLFLTCGREPSWTCATYSPWLFPANFAHGIFYLTVLGLVRMRPSSTWSSIGAGTLAGATILAHTAPALVLAAIIAAVAWTRKPRRWLLVYGATALLIAAPFLWSILWHYRLRVLNTVPMEWTYEKLTLGGLPDLLRSALNVWTLIALIGLISIVRGADSVVRRVVLAWGAAVVVLVAYRIAREHPSVHVIGIVPTIHFWSYLLALKSLLVGAGVWAIARRIPWPAVRAAAVVGVFAFLVWRRLPEYRRGEDLNVARHVALNMSPAHDEARRVVRRTSQPQDVYLAPYGGGMSIVGPAGRKTVAVNSFFSNPYVDYRRRAGDRDRMFELIRQGNAAEFRSLSATYGVTRVMAFGAPDCDALRSGGKELLVLAHRVGDVCIFDMRVR